MNGQSRVNYFVHGMEGITADTAQLTFTAPGFTDRSVDIAVAQAGFDISGLTATGTTFSPDDAFVVRVGLPNGPQTGLQVLQPVRVGGTMLTATVTSSDPLVGDLVNLAKSRDLNYEEVRMTICQPRHHLHRAPRRKR